MTEVEFQPTHPVSGTPVLSQKAVLQPGGDTGNKQRDSSGNLGQTVFWIVKNQKEPSLQQDVAYLIEMLIHLYSQ